MSDPRPSVVFGDVHGDSKRLATLISRIRDRFGSEVDIYSLGDLIDRGSDSKGVLDICVKEGVKGILGNHELWFYNVCIGGPIDDFIYSSIMGGMETVKSYGLFKGPVDVVTPKLYQAIPQAHKDYVSSLPPCRCVEAAGKFYWLLHTGMRADTAKGLIDAAQGHSLTNEALLELWYRVHRDGFFWGSPDLAGRYGGMHKFENGSVQVFGHTPVRSPIVSPHFIALDTGCSTAPPFQLSAAVLHTDGRVELLSV